MIHEVGLFAGLGHGGCRDGTGTELGRGVRQDNRLLCSGDCLGSRRCRGFGPERGGVGKMGIREQSPYRDVNLISG
jgi:hypothetical protein